jgi:DNA-binding protein HU-beta
MNTKELVADVSQKTGLSRRDAGAAVDAMIQTIADTLGRGEEVAFSGFGRFKVSQRSERQGMNPRTGERITIPASKVPRFAAGSRLKDAVASNGSR